MHFDYYSLTALKQMCDMNWSSLMDGMVSPQLLIRNCASVFTMALLRLALNLFLMGLSSWIVSRDVHLLKWVIFSPEYLLRCGKFHASSAVSHQWIDYEILSKWLCSFFSFFPYVVYWNNNIKQIAVTQICTLMTDTCFPVIVWFI